MLTAGATLRKLGVSPWYRPVGPSFFRMVRNRPDMVAWEPSINTAQHTNTHIHTRLTAVGPGLPAWAGTRKVKPVWILLKQETVSGNGISWAVCKSAPCSRQITMPALHHSVFLQIGCPSCRPTNSIKALKALKTLLTNKKHSEIWKVQKQTKHHVT